MKWNSRLNEHMWLDNDTIKWENLALGEPACTELPVIGRCVDEKEWCVMVTDQWHFDTEACDVKMCGTLCQMGKYAFFIRDD